MEYLIGFIVAIVLLLAAVDITKIKLSKLKAKLPPWANLNPAASWNNNFLDKNIWLKRVLVGLLQILILLLIFLGNLVSRVISFAWKQTKQRTLPGFKTK